MNNGKKRGGNEKGDDPRETTQQYAEDESAEEKFFQYRNGGRSQEDARHFVPEERSPQRIDMERDQNEAEAEQGKRGDDETRCNIAAGARIFLQAKITPAAHSQRAKERP